jgi:5'-nucleotidase
MRILFDLDDTVAHFRRRFDALRAEQYPLLTSIVLENHASFNLWQNRTPEEVAAIDALMNHKGFYRDLEPYEGAVDAVHEAVAMGHEVFFLSAPWITNPTGASDKYAWVEEHFGLDLAKKLILARDKTIVAGDVLFDDKHPIPNKENATWTQVYVDAPYNRDQPGYRITDWTSDQWKIVLEEIAEDKAEEAERQELLATLGTNPW